MESGTNNFDISGIVFTVDLLIVVHLISGRLSRTALLRPPMRPLWYEAPLYERQLRVVHRGEALVDEMPAQQILRLHFYLKHL